MPELYSIDEVYELKHYGVGHLDGGRSGRYPWGSGENPYQSDKGSFIGLVSDLKDKKMSDKEIAEALNMTELEYKSRWAIAMNSYYRSQGWSEKKRADHFGLTINQLRQSVAIGEAEERLYNIGLVTKLKNTGMSVAAISRETGIPDSTVRDLLAPGAEEKANKINKISDVLKQELELHDYIQVGSGVEAYLGTTKTGLNNALYNLQQQGYVVTSVQVQQQNAKGNKTTVKVLAPPGTTYGQVKENIGNVALPFEVHIDRDTDDVVKIQYPKSLDSSRIAIRYGDEADKNGVTGSDKDGVIEIRRGVDDISLGKSNYAQVRIMVDDNYYLKGMAMYSDNIPEGKDVVFNTNKKTGTELYSVLKEVPVDENGKKSDNPISVFGATIKAGGQVYYIDKDGNKQLGVVNKVNEEGDWDEWSKTLSSQMLSKQSVQLAKKQLDLSYDQQKLEYEKIMDLTNPVVKKNLLESLADDCDAKAVNLKAASMPGQRAQVILPLPELKEGEIYAPNYKNGERVVLIRYPHGGTFEIPELIVNNDNPKGKKLIGNAMDAVGINMKTANKLSGADFDGDTVLVIPNPKGTIRSTKSLADLEGFDPKSYKLPDDYTGNRLMPKERKGYYMGRVSNLITDMTIQGAPEDELARAVKHSMVVIDAPKHRLDYKQSSIDNRISELEDKYQRHIDDPSKSGGAQTLISKAKSQATVSKRKAGGYVTDENGEIILNSRGEPKIFMVDPSTGKKLYRDAPEYYPEYKVRDNTGHVHWETYSKLKKNYPENVEILDTRQVERTVASTKMYEADDAYTLSSGTKMENTYADYANKMKSLGNECRRQAYSIPTSEKVDPSAKERYASEIKDLDDKIVRAKKNEPLERQANIIAETRVKMRVSEVDAMDSDHLQRLRAQELTRARQEVGASGSKTKIALTDLEWEAMQNHAVSTNKQKEIIRYADKDRLRELATPHDKSKQVSDAEKSLIKSMAASGNSQAEIAEALGISVSTVNNYLKK